MVAVLLCGFALNARAQGATAWSKNEAREFLQRERALPEGGSLAATWLQATGARSGFVQAMAITAPGNGPVFVRYVKNGRLLTVAEAVRLGLSSTSVTPSAGQQAPMKPGKADVAPQKRPVPRLSREEMRRARRVELPAPDMNRVATEDAAAANEEKAMRIGFFRDLPQALEHVPGEKSTLANGTVWAAAITSPGALGQRIAFDQITLPHGAEIILYDAANPDMALGPLDTAGIREWPYWAPACPGETVMVECRFPADAAAQPFSLHVTRVAHIYRDPVKELVEKGFAGSCNKDVTCRPEWADYALAVGGLGTIASTGVVFCTCTLLADANPCVTLPFVLTANHCVRGQTGTRGAESLEFYWRYQTPACNGTAPSLLTVPRTVGGADYLAGMAGTGIVGGGSDFTFLRLRNEPPADLPRMGWTTTVPPTGTAVVSVHHPQGDFKRISDGAITARSNTYPDWFHEVTWSLGVTEPGSSGCPLVVAATGQIIGQLWGGGSSCSNTNDPDYYGRFDKTYTAIRAFLEPPAAFMEQSAVSADKDNTSVTIGLFLSRPADGPTDVLVTPEPLTAVPGLDYSDIPLTAHFDQGQTTQTVVFPILSNFRKTGDREFRLSLSSAAGCILPASGQSTTTVTLIDPKMPSLTIPWYVERDSEF